MCDRSLATPWSVETPTCCAARFRVVLPMKAHGGLLRRRPQQAEFRIELLVLLVGLAGGGLIGFVVIEAIVTRTQREVQLRERREGVVHVKIIVAALAAAVLDRLRETAELEQEHGPRALV